MAELGLKPELLDTGGRGNFCTWDTYALVDRRMYSTALVYGRLVQDHAAITKKIFFHSELS